MNPGTLFQLLLNVFYIQSCVTTDLVYTCKRVFQSSAHKPRNQCKHQQFCVIFLSPGQFCWGDGLQSASQRALKYAHWIGLYLSFHLNWVLGLFVHGRLQNRKTSEDTCGHDITSLIRGNLVSCRQVSRSSVSSDDGSGYLCDTISTKTLVYLISTLNASFAEYDFSDAKSEEFSKEPSLQVSSVNFQPGHICEDIFICEPQNGMYT